MQHDCLKDKPDKEYNAWEEDIAVVNIFFGEETVMGGIDQNYHRPSLGQTQLVASLFISLSLVCNRDGEEDKDGTNRVHLFDGRPLWTLPWIQLHLLLRDHLLGNYCPLKVYINMNCFATHFIAQE